MRRQSTTPRREPSLRAPIVITLVGELDYPSAARANRDLDPVTAGDRPHMVLDLTRVDFLDCGGIGVLCRARRRARAHGGRLSLVITDPRFLRILDAVGLTGSFDILSATPDTARPADGGPCVTGCDGPVSAAAAPHS
ncbi:STAS domain-containing protein [Streptomyces tubercidicus]|uniref:STAS domain-containing protein n=1 Tax=Streptomyces tubercidicus TaxID=47759 RepID=UPI0034654B10